MKVLKFLGLLIGMVMVTTYIPFGFYVCCAINAVALWKLIND